LLPLQEEGGVSREFIFQAEQALRETEQRITSSQLQEVTNAQEQLFQANQALRDLKAEIIQNQGDLLIANQEAERAQAELEAQQSEAEKIHIEALQKIQQLDVELTQLQSKISETQNLLVSAQAKLEYKYLRAPVKGTVLSLELKNTGEVLEPGQTVAEIAPDGVDLVVSATLPNQEAGFVEVGMPVQVKLDAYPYQDYGVIPGRVTNISADAQEHEQLGEVYHLEIKLEKDHITENRQIIPFKAGQTVTADIVIRNRRIIDVLLDPLKQIQQDGIDL
jgi:HlyD family secretion protein